ncbi:MAG: hypothetical protein A3B68_07935 [Candidatus Melainabacteria bacterium RIFCSPHIGHO2_02_FULL_34_12]|nr:MAG: hypothetical protein A3B68_07935 [Candidatus Melainabacteria bacterium RIFCSPHIGHO2_02_FULL_34_12]
MKRNQSLSVGIIGAGNIVSNVHLPVLLSREEIAINWIADINPIKAKSLAKAFKIPHINLPDNLSELPYTDIILLAIPYGTRERYYKAFKERASAIYAEKPFAISLEEHNRISSWFLPYKLSCGFQRRSWGPTLFTKHLIENNIFGKVNKIKFGVGSPSAFVGSASFFSDIKQSGGGILFDVGIHGIDTMLFCTSSVSLRLDNVKMIFEKEYDVHTKADFTLQNARDEQFNCEIMVSSLQDTINKLEFEFENAIISFSLFDLQGKLNIKSLNETSKYRISDIVSFNTIYPITPYQTFYDHWSCFIDGILKKEINRSSVINTLLTTELTERIYKEGRKEIQYSKAYS